MFAFVVSVWGKALLEELFGQYTSVGEAPNCSLHLQINVSIVYLVGKAILLDNAWGGKDERCVHVFVPVKGGQKIEVLYIKAHIFGAGCAEYAVPVELQGGDVSRPCRELARVIDEITTGGDSDAVGICLLRVVVGDLSGMCDNAVFWDIRYVLQGHDKHCIGPFVSCFIITLTHATRVFSECSHPYFHSVWVVHEALVATDELPGCGVNHGHGIMLVVDRRGRRWAYFHWSEDSHVVDEIVHY